MNKNIKTALVFAGGAIAGAAINEIKNRTVIRKAIREAFNEDFNEDFKYDKRHHTHVCDPSEYTFEFDTRADAEDALSHMRDILETYGVVSVADLCDYLDEQHPYTATKYGWTKLDTARIVRTRDAYVLELPRAISIV